MHRPLPFAGENYLFWEVRMQIFLEFVDKVIWDVVVNRPFILVITINDVQEAKPFGQWTVDESRRIQFVVRARNIMLSALTLDEFYRISIYIYLNKRGRS